MPDDDPLDYIDFADVVMHGDPSKWKYHGAKPGSPTPATSAWPLAALVSTMISMRMRLAI
jgi:hypothetical protein